MKEKFFSLYLLIFGRCGIAGARNCHCRIGAAGLLLAMLAGIAQANVAPEVVIHSAAMRPGTTYMDINFRVNDPDDATVKVRALAFIDGVRSFANVVRMMTFVEGTEVNIGNAVAANTDLTLTWDVPVDWDVDLAEVKIEIMARDERGLLEFDWVTIPATDTTDELTISLNAPTDAEVLNALFWLYADGDDGLVVEDGLLKGAEGNGLFEGEALEDAGILQNFHLPTLFVYNRMNLARAIHVEVSLAIDARSGITDPSLAYAANRTWNFDQIGADHSAVSSEEVNKRWVKHTYADGAIAMSDRFRGLMWFFDASANGQDNWHNAMAHCESLEYAGHADWFLPDSDQLHAMYTQKGLFSSVPTGSSSYYWSITPTTSGDGVLVVRMDDGRVATSYDKSNSYWVWPCRIGQ